jgi:sugar phosphate isomerase/epimerase
MYHLADDGSGRLVPHDDTPGELTLLDLPAAVAAQGIQTLEVCHFHFPNLEQSYLNEFRAALAEAGVELFSVLIDAGDITQPDPIGREADLAFIRNWLDVAARCGAGHARVIAGNAELPEENGAIGDHDLIKLSAGHLRELARVGRDSGVQVFTENFRALTKRPEAIVAIMERCEGQVGLCADFGNYKGETKFDDLKAILPYATSVHAKADYPQAGQMQREDFERCLMLAQAAEFDGPYSLIFDGPGSEWNSLVEIREVVKSYL